MFKTSGKSPCTPGRLPSRAWNHRCVQNCTVAMTTHLQLWSGYHLHICIWDTFTYTRFIALVPLRRHLDPKGAGQCLQGAGLPQLSHRAQRLLCPEGRRGKKREGVARTSQWVPSVGPQQCPGVLTDAHSVTDVCFCSIFNSLLFSCLPFNLFCLYCPSSLPTEHHISCLLH